MQFRRRGVAGHRAALRPDDIETADGVPVTSPARTFLDIAAVAGVTTEDPVVLGDALVSEHRRSMYSKVAMIRLPGLRAAVDAAFGFPRFRLAVDYDGAHRLTPAQQTRDALRTQEIVDAGWRLVVITRGDLRRGDAWVAARVAEVLRRQGWQDPRR
ncbi:hypothetical protein SA2016_0655 [Sinomonas atrocyanea]|uniref:DUF559 domain-containing protein n=1 Tax=Sinomonas atrocyanea TaxID=37927 RepID=A0A126ZY68_9MICC|nr:hypothetical protein [Sinomonas atrocyanea]AMM31345.1 hypothetical protein SA2016_0655 [Sinomonas atrocyanea]GEB64434.1 hypothetical protein SAT01_18820 [Sinomonas atrocyanea]GGG62910.1 hypothetical protein GCM10007172_12640 [Sinomonas atrocyanea]